MANDAIHDAVVAALENDDWDIIKENWTLRYQEVRLAVDIFAKKTIFAQQGEKKILVEVKSFSGRSFIKQLQAALGQYGMYHNIILWEELDFELYMAISERVYSLFFTRQSTKDFLNAYQVKLLVIDTDEEKVVQWIK